MTDLSLHILLFALAGTSLCLLPLMLGRFIRPRLPTDEKLAIYECGEKTIGSSYIQFDIRFYVVALLFIIFDVEVVFFFPWATVFGSATQLADGQLAEAARLNLSDKFLSLPAGTTTTETAIAAADALRFAWTGLVDLLFFFGVLLVGFAYIWNRGDLDWVRAMIRERQAAAQPATANLTAENLTAANVAATASNIHTIEAVLPRAETMP